MCAGIRLRIPHRRRDLNWEDRVVGKLTRGNEKRKIHGKLVKRHKPGIQSLLLPSLLGGVEDVVLAIEACLELGFKQDALEVAIVQVDALPGLGVSEIGAGVGSCSIDCSSDEGSFLLSHLGSDLLFNLSSQGGLFSSMIGNDIVELFDLGSVITNSGTMSRNLSLETLNFGLQVADLDISSADLIFHPFIFTNTSANMSLSTKFVRAF